MFAGEKSWWCGGVWVESTSDRTRTLSTGHICHEPWSIRSSGMRFWSITFAVFTAYQTVYRVVNKEFNFGSRSITAAVMNLHALSLRAISVISMGMIH